MCYLQDFKKLCCISSEECNTLTKPTMDVEFGGLSEEQRREVTRTLIIHAKVARRVGEEYPSLIYNNFALVSKIIQSTPVGSWFLDLDTTLPPPVEIKKTP